MHGFRHLLFFVETFMVFTAAILYLLYGHVSWTTAQIATKKEHWYKFRADDAPLWCGKAYQPQWPAIDPGGRVVVPKESSSMVLDVQCYTRMNTYFHGETTAEIIFELNPTKALYPRASGDKSHIEISNDSAGQLKLSLGAQTITIPMPTTKTFANITIDLTDRHYSRQAEILSCEVQSGAKSVTRHAELYYLPPRTHVRGSFSKLDRVTKSIMLNSTTTGAALATGWAPFIPYGFYGTPKNLSDLVKSGFNIIHVIPDLPTAENNGYGNDYAKVLKEAAELGLWIMHDMRWIWQNLTLLNDQIEGQKGLPNLLTWYTGDEPDGNTDDPAAFQASTNKIREIDSRYHVVSAVYNCADFLFEEYTKDIDIVMTDPYPVGLVSAVNGTSVYGTTCNATYGCCGCDDCGGSVSDVSHRLDTYQQFLDIYGRQSALWMVPQGFGGELHWSRFPTALEETAMQMLAINHGAMGSVSWSYRENDDRYIPARQATSQMAKLAAMIQPLLINGSRTKIPVESGFDVTRWVNSTHAFVGFVANGDSSFEPQDIKVKFAGSSTVRVDHEIGSTSFTSSGDTLVIQPVPELAADAFLVTFE